MRGSWASRRALPIGLLVAILWVLGATTGWAAPEGRIQDVQSQPGEVDFVLSAEGLAEGESIDPESVSVTIEGVRSPSTSTPITETVAAPRRTVMIALDSSGSMADNNKLATAQDAANSYLAGLPADVRAGLITFADEARVEVEPTTDRAAVSRAVAGLEARGSTALNDAVVLAVQELGSRGARNILLLSDGRDEGSAVPARQARKTLTASGSVLDAVSLGRGVQQKPLAAFAAAGGGSLVTATDAETLTAAFESAARSVESQLSVLARVPEGIQGGTRELVVTALVGEQRITDRTAALIVPSADPSGTVDSAYGPVAVPEITRGVIGQPWVLFVVIALTFVALAAASSVLLGAIDARLRKGSRGAKLLAQVSVIGRSAAPAAGRRPETALGDSAAVRSVVSLADRLAQSRDTTALTARLEEARVPLRPGEWVVVHGLIVVLALLLSAVLSAFSPVAALACLLLGLLAPWWYLDRRATRRRTQFYAALPDAMQMLAASLRAGYSLPQGLDNLAQESTGALGEELNRAVLENRLGVPIEDALEGIGHRMNSQDFLWVVMAIQVNRQVGGNLAEALTNVGATLRERERLRGQAKTLSAEGLMSAWVIGILPFAFTAFILVTAPEYMVPMLTQPIGWLLLAVALLAYLVGILWIRNLVRLEV